MIGVIATAFIYFTIDEEVAVEPAQEVETPQIAVYVSGAVKNPAVVKFSSREAVQ